MTLISIILIILLSVSSYYLIFLPIWCLISFPFQWVHMRHEHKITRRSFTTLFARFLRSRLVIVSSFEFEIYAITSNRRFQPIWTVTISGVLLAFNCSEGLLRLIFNIYWWLARWPTHHLNIHGVQLRPRFLLCFWVRRVFWQFGVGKGRLARIFRLSHGVGLFTLRWG